MYWGAGLQQYVGSRDTTQPIHRRNMLSHYLLKSVYRKACQGLHPFLSVRIKPATRELVAFPEWCSCQGCGGKHGRPRVTHVPYTSHDTNACQIGEKCGSNRDLYNCIFPGSSSAVRARCGHSAAHAGWHASALLGSCLCTWLAQQRKGR